MRRSPIGAFQNSPAAIVYCRPGTTGWGPTFAGRPTALWIELPPYSDWLPFSGLLTQYPEAIGEDDDPDQDVMSNYAEMLAGTDPTEPASVLILELILRPDDLIAEYQMAIQPTQHALYFQSVPGKSYGSQWARSLDGPWTTTCVVTATTTQKRLVFAKPTALAFYRVILAQ